MKNYEYKLNFIVLLAYKITEISALLKNNTELCEASHAHLIISKLKLISLKCLLIQR